MDPKSEVKTDKKRGEFYPYKNWGAEQVLAILKGEAHTSFEVILTLGTHILHRQFYPVLRGRNKFQTCDFPILPLLPITTMQS